MSAPLLQLAACTMRFGGLTALDAFTLDLPRGALCGVIGPNGAGKTTLFNLITGVYRPTAGVITFADTDLGPLPPHRINRLGIARTFQNIRLFGERTVEANVTVAMHRAIRSSLWGFAFGTPRARIEREEVRARAEQLLETFGLWAVAAQLAKHLPYGQQRKLELARALATDPQLLCLDEPAAGMTVTEKNELIGLIRQLNARGLTILLVEHDMHVVMNLCPHIVVLDYGETIARGTPDEIRRHPKVIEAYLGEPYHEV